MHLQEHVSKDSAMSSLAYVCKEFPPNGFVLAVAEGFPRRKDDRMFLGGEVSRLVIGEVENVLDGLEKADHKTMSALDRHIDQKTVKCAAGSTLALAYCPSDGSDIVFMCRGNSLIIASPDSSAFEPGAGRIDKRLVQIYPPAVLRKRKGLWTCYGDCQEIGEGREGASIDHPETPVRLLMVTSVGLFPSLNHAILHKCHAVEYTARRYFNYIIEGRTPADLVNDLLMRAGHGGYIRKADHVVLTAQL